MVKKLCQSIPVMTPQFLDSGWWMVPVDGFADDDNGLYFINVNIHRLMI